MYNIPTDHITILVEPLKIFYQRYGGGITDANIDAILSRWLNLLPDEALRLILTIVQAGGTGLTTYLTIMEAIGTFPNFPWQQVKTDFPAEWAKLEAAYRAVGQNRWYGYRKDLGVAKSTNFKFIAFIAKSLLIDGAGKKSLRGYAGWAKSIPRADKWRWIIARFLRTSDEDRPEYGPYADGNGIPAELADAFGTN